MDTEKLSQVVKAAVTATLLSVVLALLFALVHYVAPQSQKTVTIVSQSLKACSLLIACLLFLRGEAGLVKGLLSGLLFTLSSYLCFSAIGGSFALSWLILVDFALGIGVGSLSGIAAVNLRRA